MVVSFPNVNGSSIKVNKTTHIYRKSLSIIWSLNLAMVELIFVALINNGFDYFLCFKINYTMPGKGSLGVWLVLWLVYHVFMINEHLERHGA